ncbi:MAG: phytanoyl-CoA dioxygenase family protein [Alphaproteobacteria bacterium]
MIPWDPTTLPKPTQDLARLKADMDQFGYCMIEAAFPRTVMDAIRTRLAEQAAAERKHGHHRRSEVQDPGGVNQWVGLLINKGKVFQGVLFHPLIEGVVEHLLGPEFTLSDFAAHITRPGNSLLPLHMDQWWMPMPAMPGEPYVRASTISRENVRTGPPTRSTTPINPPMVVNAMCMISDFTEENGATRLVPTSHLSGTQPEPSLPHPVPTVAATGPAGNVVIWEGRTWHAAGANVSREERYGLVSYYAAPQSRSLQNFTLATKPEILEGASPELLRLLGFKVWHSYGQTGLSGGEYAKPASELIGELKP